eukprot:gene9033-10667_t
MLCQTGFAAGDLPVATPTMAPTNDPTETPITDPTVSPTVTPTAKPTEGPTHNPSTGPTVIPTLGPTHAPTISPSLVPTAPPTANPSATPSETPTHTPTLHPTVHPSAVPSAMPSECEAAEIPCYVGTGTFTVGFNTTLTVRGGCEFVVNATSTITMENNSTVQASSVYFSAKSSVDIAGTVRTSGRGPEEGPGAPSVEERGRGGTYGGSGGQFLCKKDYYYSNFRIQIGSIDVFADLEKSSPNNQATFGSGGGAPGAGLGGGRIVIKSQSNVHIHSTGVLDASGTSANVTALASSILPTNGTDSPHNGPYGNATLLGAGSGGSVAIMAIGVAQEGFITVAGGPAATAAGTGAGAAGGGGRISIMISSGSLRALLDSNIAYHGGSALDQINSTCVTGGAGTLYVQYRNGATLVNSIVAVSNRYVATYAVTLLQSLPHYITGISALDSAVISSNGSIVLPPLTQCSVNVIHSFACSALIFRDAYLVTLSSARNLTETRESIVSTVSADLIHLSGSHIAGIRLSPFSFNIVAGEFIMSENSTVEYTQRFDVKVKYNAHMLGSLTQMPETLNLRTREAVYFTQSQFRVVAGHNVTISNVSVSNMVVNGDRIVVPPNSILRKVEGVPVPSCFRNITEAQFSCNTYRYTGLYTDNNTYAFVANSSLSISAITVAASQVLLCAPLVAIHAGSTIDANFRGCKANKGAGAGGMPSAPGDPNPVGGGGGGYGGNGGQGYNAVNFGLAHFSKYSLSSGSGGGCVSCNRTQSAGGGLINIVSNRTMLEGNLTAVGSDAVNGAGGGSGGSIAINALEMSGQGRITATGGSGGTGFFPGGGGGGGVVSLFNAINSYQLYSFTGFVNVEGGIAGITPSSSNVYETSVEVSYDNSIYGYSPATRNLRNVYANNDPTPAQPGQPGQKYLPTCKAGTGNQVSGAICETCPVGTYSTGLSTGPCQKCTNAPSHADYIGTGATTPDCDYECESSYVTEHCYNQVQNFIYNVVGVPAFACMCVGVFLLLMVPLGYTRLKRRYGYFTYLDKKTQKRRDVFGFDFFNSDHDDDNFMFESQHNKDRSTIIKMETFTTNNPVLKASTDNRDSTDSAAASTRIRALRNKMFAERRREHRMTDQDLVFHAYRINLFGSNHPFQSRGGPWRFPTVRPACLRPMLKRQEFRELAEKINKAMEWQILGFELLSYALVTLFTPPFAAHVMKTLRRHRGNRLLKMIASYDYACFRCPKQRSAQNSLRIGISPDFTLAYVDFLFDEDYFQNRTKPLCATGQVKLPVSFKIAGLGTYFSPYLIDTNDLLLQAVPQTDIPSSFINDAWIKFVVDLNTILRTVQSDSVHLGVYNLIRYLSEEQHVTNLGGLVVEFCTFSNNESVYKSEQERALRDRIEAEQQQQAALTSPEASSTSPVPSPLTTQNLPSKLTKADSQAEVDRFSMDSFGAATGRRKSEDGGWFTNFLDVASPWTLGAGGTSSKKHKDKPQEIELRSSSFKASHKDMGISITSRESRESSAKLVNNTAAAGGYCNWRKIPGLEYVVESIAWVYTTVYTFIAKKLSSGYTTSDPAGKYLTFHEMCNAIQEGNLTMGIIVTHPKVIMHNYVVQDEDYESEDEAFYAEEDLKTSPKRRLLGQLQGSDVSDTDKSDTDVDEEEPTSENDTPVSRATSNATDVSVNMQSVYGDKADEMQKFYNIMLTAEASMTPISSPIEPAADRKKFGGVNPMTRLGRDSPALSENVGDKKVRIHSSRPAAKSGTTPSPESKEKETMRPRSLQERRASAFGASEKSGVNMPERKAASVRTNPVKEQEVRAVPTGVEIAAKEASSTDVAANVDPQTAIDETPPVEPLADSPTSDRKSKDSVDTPEKPILATQTELSADKGTPEVRSRSRSVSEDSFVLLSRQEKAQLNAREQEEAHEESVEAADSGENEVAPTAQTGFRYSTGSISSGDEGNDEVGAVKVTKSGSQDDSQREKDQAGGDSVPVDAVESDAAAAISKTSEADTPAPVPQRLISMDLTGFRRSDVSDTADDTAVESPPAAARFMVTRSKSRSDASSASNATPSRGIEKQSSRSDVEEYTDFRSPTSRRPTTVAMMELEDFRHSDFRHSDRISDFGYEDRQISVGASLARYSEYEKDDFEDEEINDFGRDDSFAVPQSFSTRGGRTRSEDHSTAQSERSNRPKSMRFGPGPDISTVTPKRTHQLRRNKKNAANKQKKAKRKVQKDLSQVNLAPSAYQQEHSTWRLLENTTMPVSEAELMVRPSTNSFDYGNNTSQHGLQSDLPRHSMMVDRSSMITADDRNVEMEEGGLGAVGGMQVNPMRQISTISNHNMAAWSQDHSRTRSVETTRDSEAELESKIKGRPASAKLTLRFLQSDGRPSDAATTHTGNTANASKVLAATTAGALHMIEESFQTIYFTRVVLLFLSRFFFGGNVMPLGRPTVRRVLELMLLFFSLIDIALGAIICFEYYCASDDSTTCQDHTSMFQILFMWPLALVITPIMGVTAIMLGPHANLTRIYASWARLAGVNNIMMAAVYIRYLSFFINLPISTYPPIIYTCSRMIQCLIVDQYIAHIEKLRYTRGWDGLSTSLFMTQDSKTLINT